MTLCELVSIMNIADVGIASDTIHDLYPCLDKKIDMLHLSIDPILERYGDREVEKLTNICKTGDVVWIK